MLMYCELIAVFRRSIQSRVFSVVTQRRVNIYSPCRPHVQRAGFAINARSVHAYLTARARCKYTNASTPGKNPRCARSAVGLSNIAPICRSTWWSMLVSGRTSAACVRVRSTRDTVWWHTCAYIREWVRITARDVTNDSAPRTASWFGSTLLSSADLLSTFQSF